jgi:hypothetical protein
MQLGQRGADWAPKLAGQVSLGRPAWAQLGPVRVLLRLVLLPESSRSSPLLHVGPCRQFLSELDEASYLARFNTFLARSSEFVFFSGLVPRLLESYSLHCLTCTGLQGLVMRCLMNLSRKSCFQRKTLRKHLTPKPTCTSELVIPRGLVPMDKIQKSCQHRR